MIIQNEEQILDQKVRKKIIEEIEGTENKDRKAEAFKRYQCYKDQGYLYVRNELLKQFDANTVNEMSYALSNIAIVRKIIDKLARVYKYGVERDIEGSDEAITVAEEESNVNAALKKTNRFFKLFKNTLLYIRPKPINEDGTQTIKLTPLPPYLYDAVEMADEREKAMAIILSDYKPDTPTLNALRPGTDGRVNAPMQTVRSQGDNIDQIIADSPFDKNSGKYIFWTKNFHFVCNPQGEIVGGPENLVNEIGELPFVNFAEDQDGSFWAIGGDDLVGGSILVNSMITNINHIAITQGYGQLVVTGEDIPQTIKVGPNHAVRLTHTADQPKPEFDFKSANPPLNELRALVEMYVALILSTNNLSTAGVASNLNGGTPFPSGIAMMLDKAESMEDVEDQRQVFIDGEPKLWNIYAKWHTLLKSRGELPEKLNSISFPENPEVNLQFGQPKAIESEKERLEVLKLKKDLGLVSMIDMIKEEYPGLDDTQATAKLKEILEEKMKYGSQGQQDNGQPNDGSDRLGGEGFGGDEAGDRGVSNRADSSEGSEQDESSDG